MKFDSEIPEYNLRRSVFLLVLPHESECTRSLLLVSREDRGHVVLLCLVIASSSKHGDIMRRTFVVQEGMILLEMHQAPCQLCLLDASTPRSRFMREGAYYDSMVVRTHAPHY